LLRRWDKFTAGFREETVSVCDGDGDYLEIILFKQHRCAFAEQISAIARRLAGHLEKGSSRNLVGGDKTQSINRNEARTDSWQDWLRLAHSGYRQ